MQATQPNSGTEQATTDGNIKRHAGKPDIMGLVEIPTRQLTGAGLDWAVAVALGWQLVFAKFFSFGIKSSSPVPEWAQLCIAGVACSTYEIERGAFWLDYQNQEVHEAFFPGCQACHAPFAPTDNWIHTGPLIERFHLDVVDMQDGEWWACNDQGGGDSNAPQEAICRGAVDIALGHTVRVPAVLLQGVAHG